MLLVMSILNEIQASILDPNAKLSAILLKLRFLASRLGSEPLADWVKYETDGYLKGVEVPDYRIVRVQYSGTFSGPFGSGINNAPIPSAVIEKYASKSWTHHEVRQSIAAVDELAAHDSIGIDASNLILLLQGNIYPDMACNAIRGSVSPVAMKEIQTVVRSRVLELTLELEKSVPAAMEVTLQKPIADKPNGEEVTRIVNATLYRYGTTARLPSGEGSE